ncbi:MAG: response regulator [Candidatus Thermoplasmatota archaeon]
MRKKIMLIVDDEKEIHELIKEYLSPLNIEFYSAYNGKEAIKIYNELMAKNKKPDLVVMDLNLSGSRKFEDLIKQMEGKEMDGVKTTEEILKIDRNANVVGFTAFAHLEWGKRLKSLGIKNVFGREIGFDGFAKKISEILS